MTRFADLHFHVYTKQLVEGQGRLSIWRKNPNPKPRKRRKAKRAKATSFYQSDLRRTIRGQVKLGFAALHPLERPLISVGITRRIARIAFGLKARDLAKLAKKTHFEVLRLEYEAYLRAPDKMGALRFAWVTNREILKKRDLAKLILTIEGGHALQGNESRRGSKGLGVQILKNLREIKTNGDAWPIPIFFLTLTHFTDNGFIGQSQAIPVPGIVPKWLKRLLLPKTENANTRLTSLGKEVAELALNEEVGYRMLLDLKHTHIDSRFDLYKQVYQDSEGRYRYPIIHSHSAVSGIKTYEEARRVNPRKHVAKEARYKRFNPWEINLCDEEIKITFLSGGLIGLAMEERILGAGNDDFERRLKDHLRSKGLTTGVEKWWQTSMWLENLFYIINVIYQDKEIPEEDKPRAWDMVCVGSDFDGFADPIFQCRDITELGRLERSIATNIKRLYLGYDMPSYQDLLQKIPLKKALRKVFYKNLERFTDEHFPI